MGVLTGYPPLIEIVKKNKKIKFLKFDFIPRSHKSRKILEKLEKIKNMENTNVCITLRIIFYNFFRNNLDMLFFLLIFAELKYYAPCTSSHGCHPGII